MNLKKLNDSKNRKAKKIAVRDADIDLSSAFSKFGKKPIHTIKPEPEASEEVEVLHNGKFEYLPEEANGGPSPTVPYTKGIKEGKAKQVSAGEEDTRGFAFKRGIRGKHSDNNYIELYRLLTQDPNFLKMYRSYDPDMRVARDDNDLEHVGSQVWEYLIRPKAHKEGDQYLNFFDRWDPSKDLASLAYSAARNWIGANLRSKEVSSMVNASEGGSDVNEFDLTRVSEEEGDEDMVVNLDEIESENLMEENTGLTDFLSKFNTFDKTDDKGQPLASARLILNKEEYDRALNSLAKIPLESKNQISRWLNNDLKFIKELSEAKVNIPFFKSLLAGNPYSISLKMAELPNPQEVSSNATERSDVPKVRSNTRITQKAFNPNSWILLIKNLVGAKRAKELLGDKNPADMTPEEREEIMSIAESESGK